MSGQAFQRRQPLDRRCHGRRAGLAGAQYRGGLLERLDRDAAMGPRRTAGGQGVIGSSGVISRGFRRPRPDKDRAGMTHTAHQRFGLAELKDQVFRGVGIGDICGFSEAVAQDGARIGHGLTGDVGAGQSLQLRLDGGENAFTRGLIETDQHHLR